MDKILNSKSPDYPEQLLALRKARQLHTVVENRLIELLGVVTPSMHPLKELQGLAGGRNDLMLFEFSGKKVVLEVFATASQVSRDLLILHKTKADRKIAVIIDETVDPKIFERFIRENPDESFPFVFIGELFEDPPTNAYLKLRVLIAGDEEATFQRMLRAKISKANFLNWCKQHGINVFSGEELRNHDITYAQVFVAIVLLKCRKQGIAKGKLKSLGQWLSKQNTLNYIFFRVDAGFNMFLYTDLNENFAAYSDIELSDWIRAGHYFSQPYILLSLNAVIYELEDRYLKSGGPILNPKREISVTIGASQVYESSEGRVAIYSLPSKIQSVVLLPPMQQDKTPDEYLELVRVSTPGETIEID